ncbi:MAG: CBS domain-containing protein [Candidatus Azotimanducaceae bacterium]|jgi:CBS domain-containing protein
MLSIDKIMTTDLFTLRKEDSLANAEQLMREHRVRHIPIIDDEKHLIGLITQRDILAANLSDTSVADVMRREIYTISESADMRSAALMLQNHKIGSLPVVREGVLVGIITDTDYVGLAINLLEQMEEAEQEDFDDYDSGDALGGV